MADRSPRYAALRLRSYRNLAFVALLLLSLPSIWYLRTDLALYGTGSAALWLRFGARSTLIAAAAGGLPAIRSPVSFDGHSGAVAAAAWGIVASLLALTTLRPPGAGLPLEAEAEFKGPARTALAAREPRKDDVPVERRPVGGSRPFATRSTPMMPTLTSLKLRLQGAWLRLRRGHRDVEQVFTEIYHRNYWQGADSRSGTGSEGDQTRRVVEAIPRICRELSVSSLLDIPCGDFNWMKEVPLDGVAYLGADIVAELIEENRLRHSGPGIRFEHLDLLKGPLPRADLVLCRDCLVHFGYVDTFRALKAICESGATWLLTTTFPERRSNQDIVTGQWRPINLQLPPFHLPSPTRLLYEGCTEDDGRYADKALGLWSTESVRNTLVASHP